MKLRALEKDLWILTAHTAFHFDGIQIAFQLSQEATEMPITLIRSRNRQSVQLCSYFRLINRVVN